MTRPYLSSYVYADNRPTVLTDPSGLRPGGGMWEKDPAVQSFSNNNTCGSIWCFIRSEEGKRSIGCGLFVGGGVALVGVVSGGIAITLVGRGFVAAFETALTYERAATGAASAVAGGTILSRGGFPCR